jgi:antirestriction protein ArdC
MTNPTDYRKTLTEKIIAQLQDGTAPWVRPWDETMAAPGLPFNASTGRSYRGGNRLWLQCQGHEDPRWCTYRQALERGWQVRRGEKACTVEYWQWEKEATDAAGNPVRVRLERPKVFYAHVFNASQLDHVPPWEAQGYAWAPEAEAEKILKNSGARIIHTPTPRAYYSPIRDEIHLPPPAFFPAASRYYGTALHELGHWSGHASRLNRDLSGVFGTPPYAREELKAELASYFLSARLGIPHDPQQHAAYIGSWIQLLREDHNEIFRAAQDAERITDYVLQFQQEQGLTPVQSPDPPAGSSRERGRQALRAIRQQLEAVQEC